MKNYECEHVLSVSCCCFFRFVFFECTQWNYKFVLESTQKLNNFANAIDFHWGFLFSCCCFFFRIILLRIHSCICITFKYCQYCTKRFCLCFMLYSLYVTKPKIQVNRYEQRSVCVFSSCSSRQLYRYAYAHFMWLTV